MGRGGGRVWSHLAWLLSDNAGKSGEGALSSASACSEHCPLNPPTYRTITADAGHFIWESGLPTLHPLFPPSRKFLNSLLVVTV